MTSTSPDSRAATRVAADRDRREDDFLEIVFGVYSTNSVDLKTVFTPG